MKKIFQIILVVTFVGFSTQIFAQKFGHIDSQELLFAMPERANVEVAIKAHYKELEEQLNAMRMEYETKLNDYQAKVATISETIKKVKEKEIIELQTRMQEFQGSAQEDLENKEKELLQPIIEKAKKAIEEVSKENKYTYIFDSSLGVLLFKPETDDILLLVKKKLNIVTTPASAPGLGPKK